MGRPSKTITAVGNRSKSKQKLRMCKLSRFSCFPLFETPRTIGHRTPAHGILQARRWSRLPCPLPGDLPDPGIKPMSPVSTALQANSLPTEPPEKPRSQGMDVWRKEDTRGYGQSWQGASRSAAITESGIRIHATCHKNLLKTITLYNTALTRHLNVAWTPKFLPNITTIVLFFIVSSHCHIHF